MLYFFNILNTIHSYFFIRLEHNIDLYNEQYKYHLYIHTLILEDCITILFNHIFMNIYSLILN